MGDGVVTKAGTTRGRERASIGQLHPDISVTLDRVERRRAHLWGVAALFMVGVSAILAVTLSGIDASEVMPDSPTLRWSLLAIGATFLIYVVDQERRLRSLTRRLFEAEVLAAALHSRISDLTTLTRVGHLVNSYLTMEEVLEVLLDAVFELTDARRGSVTFLEGDDLVVAVSAGADAPPRGALHPADRGVAGWVVAHREPLLISGRLDTSQFPGHIERAGKPGSSISAPLMAGDELIGVLSVERGAGQPPFDEIQLRSVALFAAQAATAVINARRYEEERSRVESLATALERRSEFVATLVHELKNPLTAIVGFSSVLGQRADAVEGEVRDRMITSIGDQAQRLRDMVEEVLNVASADAGADLARKPVMIRELIDAAVASAHAVAIARDGQPRAITGTVPDDLPVVYGDATALSRVVANLLENAVKYSDAATPVHVEVTHGASEVRIGVIDNGPGIPEDQQELIFERFRRSTEGRAAGAGLGLYIVRSLVTAHGGKVWVESEPGAGSTFIVTLPVRVAERSDEVDVPEPSAVASPQSTK
ncbi:MAG: GAF domain-containing protein [Actinobacteria bacterium]|nr:GAF domain-containing protein [Actinomycetota bacterium]